MISEDGEWVLCSVGDCENKIKNHRWGRIKADDWFFSRGQEQEQDKAYCPDHIPGWVALWRKRKNNG